MTTTNPDTEAFDTTSGIVTLEGGFEVEVQRLKLRQLLRALKVLSSGAGSALGALSFNENSDQDEIAQTVLFAMAIAIPEAENETVEFLSSMVIPVGFKEGRDLSKSVKAKNAQLLEELDEILFNPSLDDVLSIVEVVIEKEAPHLKSLGNRLATLLKAQQKSEVAKQASASKKESKS